jgi:serine/threonine-protein kinase
MANPATARPTSRYELLVKVASGGMATVFVGRLRGPAGFSRLVAIKRAHARLVEDESFRRMLIAEARLASKLHHPNVVAIDDVEEIAGELRLVMDYVEGSSLSEVLAAATGTGHRFAARVAVRIALDACAGLHAAHTLTDEHGDALELVHRDVTPHNILVGVDGTSRLADFGIAKCARSSLATTAGTIKGKVGYMSPEYIGGAEPDARSDVFGLGVVLWEALAGRKLFRGSNELETIQRVVSDPAPRISSVAPWIGGALDDVLASTLEKSPDERFQSARALGAALESAAGRAGLIGSYGDVSAELDKLCGDALARRRQLVRERIAEADAENDGTKSFPRLERPERIGAAGRGVANDAQSEPLRERSAADMRSRAVDESLPDPHGASTLTGSGVTERLARVDSTDVIAGVPRRQPVLLVAAAGVVIAALVLTVFVVQRARSAATAPQVTSASSAAVGENGATSAAPSAAPIAASANPDRPTPDSRASPPSSSSRPAPTSTTNGARKTTSGSGRAPPAAPANSDALPPNPYRSPAPP